MPGSEYYDYEPSAEEVAWNEKRRKARYAYWLATLAKLNSITSSDSPFEKKLFELKDYAKARLWKNND